jgi:hypothetical protein
VKRGKKKTVAGEEDEQQPIIMLGFRKAQGGEGVTGVYHHTDDVYDEVER